MAVPAKCIEVPEGERVELERIVRSESGEVRMVEPAQIVLYAAEGHSAAANRSGGGVRDRHRADAIHVPVERYYWVN
jgi:hypothetical protein